MAGNCVRNGHGASTDPRMGQEDARLQQRANVTCRGLEARCVQRHKQL